MYANLLITVDLLAFTKEIFKGACHFFCSVSSFNYLYARTLHQDILYATSILTVLKTKREWEAKRNSVVIDRRLLQIRDYLTNTSATARKVKFSCKSFFSKCVQSCWNKEIVTKKHHFLFSVLFWTSISDNSFINFS